MKNQKGFTVIEGMIVVAVIGILAAVALPSFEQSFQKERVKAVASDLYLDLYEAKSQAIKRNESIQFNFNTAGWSLVDTNGTILKEYSYSGYKGVRVIANTEFMVFDSIRGATSAQTIQVLLGQSDYGVLVTPLGFVDICRKTSEGYTSC